MSELGYSYFLHAKVSLQAVDKQLRQILSIWLFTGDGILKHSIPSSDKDKAIMATCPFTPFRYNLNEAGTPTAERTPPEMDSHNPLVPIRFRAKRGDSRKCWAALEYEDIPKELLDCLASNRTTLHVSVFLNDREMPPATHLYDHPYEVRFKSQGNPTQKGFFFPKIAGIFNNRQVPLISPASLDCVLPASTLHNLKENHHIVFGVPLLPNTLTFSSSHSGANGDPRPPGTHA